MPDAAADLRTSDVMIFPHLVSADLHCLDLFRDRWVCVADEGLALGDPVTSRSWGRRGG